MTKVTPQQALVIKRCQKSVTWFLRNFGKLKHPSAGVLPFYPFSYQRQAIKAFREHRLNIFRKCRQCFSGDSMVWGPNGPKRIDSIKPGDEVYSYNEITQRLDVVPVEEVFDNGEREVCEVQTKTGHTSTATIDHNYFTYNGQIEAQDLTTNDRLLEINEIFNKEPRQEISFFFNRKKGEVKRVICNGDIVRVYDLKVPPHHNYVVDGVVVHNSGISKISGAFATWFGMFHPHKTILIVSRRNEDAMAFLRDHIVFLYEHLPPWMKDIWEPVKQNEHEIIFPNGSRIQSLTSHPDVLRSHASSLNIIDEAAFIQGMDVMWGGGWPCSRGDTLIQTTEGLIKIEELANGGDPWKNVDIDVMTDEGLQHSDKAFVSGRKPTTILNTYLGFEFEGADHHKIRIIDNNGLYIWRRLDQIRPDDIIVLIPGTFSGRRRTLSNGVELDEKIAEIIGLYVGDGSLSINRPKRFKIFFDPQDVGTRDTIVSQFNNIFDLEEQAYPECSGTTENLRLNSAAFSELMVENGLRSKTCPHDAQIPPIILQSDKVVLCAFLRGLFDSDGWCYPSSTCLKLGFSTVSEKLAEQVQICLHSLGIISRRILVDPSGFKNEDRYSDEPYWRVDVWDSNSKLIFRDRIGFLTERKQRALDSFKGSNEHSEISHYRLVQEFAIEAKATMLKGGTFRECQDPRKWNIYRIAREGRVRLSLVRELTDEFGLTNRLSEYVKKGFLFDVVTNVRNGETELFDLSVPRNNTYLANGIVSHNTLQHGGNVICISTCVAPETIINTANGLCEIQDLAPDDYDGYDHGYYHTDYHGPDIVGINGLESSTKFYKRPKEATKIIRTTCGYELEASLRHKILSVDKDTGEIVQKYVHQLNIDDYLPVKAGQMVFGNDNIINYIDSDRRFNDPTTRTFKVDKIDEDLAYLLGVLIAEGHVREEGVMLSCGDPEVLDRCESWRDLGWNRGRKDQDYVTVCTRPMFVRFLQFLGVELTTAPYKTIPKRLLKCSESIIREFLKGLFDGDGFAAKRNGQPGLASTSYKLVKQVRMLLFNYGIHTYLETIPPGETQFMRKSGEITYYKTNKSYRLIVSSNFAEFFYDLIGFDLDRKQSRRNNKPSNWSELMPPVVRILLKGLKDSTDLSISKMTSLGLAPNVLFGSRKQITKNRLSDFLDKIDYSGNKYYDQLCKLLEYDWFNVVVDLEDSENEVYDFTLPGTHTFIGDCFININTHGIGNWYWNTMTDAEAGVNDFNPLIINWWDMDWVIQYRDPLSRRKKRIAPRDGIRECRTKEEIEKFGPYWSPWLQEQYDALQEQGEAWKFQQEILASFIGSGNTVLSPSVISHVITTVKDPEQKVTGYQTYVHPVSGNVEQMDFDFGPDEGLWVWKKPVIAVPEKRRGDQIVQPGRPAHSYTMGVDIATGKGRDYSAIEVFDVDEMEQVAEFMAHCLPRDFVKFVDRIGRWYNCALAVIERNNGGDAFIDNMRYDVMYPRLWRKKDVNDRPTPQGSKQGPRALKVLPYGFATSVASKPTLNKFLIDFIRDKEGDGYSIFSKRLLKQLQTYVRKRDRSGKDTGKTEAEEGAGNFDDLVMACGLALVGTSDAFITDAGNLLPFGGGGGDFKTQSGPTIFGDELNIETQKLYAEQGGPALMMPMSLAPEEIPEISAQRQLDAYTLQLGGIPIGQGNPTVVPPKFFYDRKNSK